MTRPTNRQDFEDRYRRWWEGKYCRRAHSGAEFRLVKRVFFIGPPSGISGLVELAFEDGSRGLVYPLDPNAFKPRKKDIEVRE